MTLNEQIMAVLQQAKAEIQANMAAKNINASGRSYAAFSVHADNAHISLVMEAGNHAPLATLEIGRPGGNVPGGFRMTKAGVLDVSNKFKWILIKWAEEKGFTLNWGGATMLGRRIAASGTLRHQTPVDVYSTPVNMAVARLREKTKSQVLAEVHKIVTTNF